MKEVKEGYVTSNGKYYEHKEVAEQEQIILDIRACLDVRPFPVGAHTGISATLNHISENYTLTRKAK